MTAERRTDWIRRTTDAIASRQRAVPESRPLRPRTVGGRGSMAQAAAVRPVAARSTSGCRPAIRTAEPAPIWMAALLASPCQAVSEAVPRRAVRWECVAGHALYTNRSVVSECIEPLGVRVGAGETLSVTWLPGETAYTLEIFDRGKQYLVA
jgi:hypothetical protein